jgi:hypothetical protein
MKVNPFLKLFSGNFFADDLLDAWKDIGKAVGQVVNDDALELGVLEDLD